MEPYQNSSWKFITVLGLCIVDYFVTYVQPLALGLGLPMSQVILTLVVK